MPHASEEYRYSTRDHEVQRILKTILWQYLTSRLDWTFEELHTKEVVQQEYDKLLELLKNRYKERAGR